MFWRIKTVSESPYSREGWFYLAKAFGMCNNKKLARELFKLCTKFNKETSLEVTCEMWDDNLLNKYLLSTI